MEIKTQHSQDKSVIIIDNDKLIGNENEIFQKAVQESIDTGSKNISIDLSSVKYMSSMGIGILVHAYTTCFNKNIKFNIKGANEGVLNVLSHLKLTELFNIV